MMNIDEVFNRLGVANDKGFLVEFKTNPYLNKVVNCYRQEHEQCLSKQRVKEAFEIFEKDINNHTYQELKNDLGLEEE